MDLEKESEIISFVKNINAVFLWSLNFAETFK